MLTGQLALSVTPLAGETPASIVSRMAARNETAPRVFCSDMGMRWPFLCSGHADQLDLLSELGGIDRSQLERWNPEQKGIGRYRIGKTLSSTGAFRRTATRICPVCIEEAIAERGIPGIHQLLEWNILCLHGCAQHSVSLIELPKAETSHEAYDVVAQVLRHRDKVRRAASEPARHLPSVFESYVRDRIFDGPQADWLKGLELTQLHRACLTLGSAILGGDAKFLFQEPLSRSQRYCDEGLRVLTGGYDSLAKRLEDLRCAPKDQRPYCSRDLGSFYSWLRTAYRNTELVEIADCVRSFVFENYTTNPEKRILGKAPPDRHRMSFDTARIQSGVGVALLKRLIAHVDQLQEGEAAQLTETTPDQLARALKFWSGLCNLTAAAAALKVRPVQVKALINRGLLRSIKFGTALRYVYLEDLDRLTAAVSELPKVDNSKGYLPISQYCRENGIGLVRIIQLWQNGELEKLVRSGGGEGMRSIHVPCKEGSVRTQQDLLGDLTPEETARYLQIGISSVRALRNAGFLKQIVRQNPDTNHHHAVITQDSIRAFETCYLTLGQIAEGAKIAPIHMARKLDRAEIPAVEETECFVRVYRRDLLPAELSGRQT